MTSPDSPDQPRANDDSAEAPPSGEILERLDALARHDHQAAQHLVRYDWAAGCIPAGARVLDCACGLGYGSELLVGANPKHILAIDASEDALAYARREHANPLIEYRCADALSLDAATVGTFDAIVSLETIEHLADPQRLLDVFRSLLAPGGVLLVSVPNDTKLEAENPHHLWRAPFEEVHAWLTSRFAHVVACAQVHIVGSAVWARSLLTPTSPSVADGVARRVDHVALDDAAGYLFACSAEPIESRGPVSSQLVSGFDYVRGLERALDTNWAESQRLLKNWEQNRDTIKALEQTREEQRGRLESSMANAARLEGLLAEARERLESTKSRTEHDEGVIAELRASVEALTDGLEDARAEVRTLETANTALKSRSDAIRNKPLYRLLSSLGLLPRR